MKKSAQTNLSASIALEERRNFLKKIGLATAAFGFAMPVFPESLKDVPMGIVVHSYGARWNSKAGSTKYPAFEHAIHLMEHCKKIGAGGVQVGVNGWVGDFAKQVRDAREKLDLYLEGSIGLPKSSDDLERFETELLAAKEAGVQVLRTVCLNGRRYEDFHSEAEFQAFKSNALKSIELAEPVVRRHQMKLAIENHKDWKAEELAEIIRNLGSEWVGVTLDFGNNVSLMEDPMHVIRTLAPLAFSTHVKDMGVKEYEDGFLLSEVPLGEGIVDLKAGIDLCKKYNPDIRFSLEMITRDPLEIPCMTDGYWETLGMVPAHELASMLRQIREKSFADELPRVSGLDAEGRLAFEEENVLESLTFSKRQLLNET